MKVNLMSKEKQKRKLFERLGEATRPQNGNILVSPYASRRTCKWTVEEPRSMTINYSRSDAMQILSFS